MGVEVEVRIIQPGYVPKGGGRIELQIMPVKGTLKPLNLVSQGQDRENEGNRPLVTPQGEKRIPKNGEGM